MTAIETIRDAIRYIRRFKGATAVVHIDDSLMDLPLFAGHIQDLSLLFEAGIRLVIVPGAKAAISRVLAAYRAPWRFVDGIRITSPEGMDLVKMAAFDVASRIMSRLEAERLHGITGSWVSAHGKGTVGGTDFGSAGLIDRVDAPSLKVALDDGFIPIVPCVGWTATGKAYNISSAELAARAARALKADKLFFLEDGIALSAGDFAPPEGSVISCDNRIASISVDDVEDFIIRNKMEERGAANAGGETDDILYSNKSARAACLLRRCREACLDGVARAHIINGAEDGAIPAEIFSDAGSGTMIFKSDYSKFRPMAEADVPAVISLMHPFVKSGRLIPRSEEEVKGEARNFTVYEIDGAIRACAALKPYPDFNCAEIAAVAVDDSCANSGIGPALLKRLLAEAKGKGFSFVFALTTQAADWFERFGFVPAGKEAIPPERARKMSPERGSRILLLRLDS